MKVDLETARANRAYAIANGLSRFQGRPCYKKHSGMRYVVGNGGGDCVECCALRAARSRNPVFGTAHLNRPRFIALNRFPPLEL